MAGKRLFKQWLCAPLCNPTAINDRFVLDLSGMTWFYSVLACLMVNILEYHFILVSLPHMRRFQDVSK